MKYSAKQKEALFKAIYDGEITADNLPKDLYGAIATHLTSAVDKGFGAALEDLEFGAPDFKMLESLRENVFMFSGAKVYWQCEEMNELKDKMVSESEVVSFKEFKESADEVYDKYNVNWLEAEYNTAIGQSQAARGWLDIEDQKDALPMLRYSIVDDANTSEICLALDGMIKPVDDPIWDIYSPLNHYNCRCLLESVDDDHEESPTPDDLEAPDGVFASNPGKTGEVFNKDHPYFDVPKEYRDLAKDNFGLPIPEIDE